MANHDEEIEFYQPNLKPKEEEMPPVEIPPEALSPEAMKGIIDEFILREGTDYGAAEAGHDTKIQQVRRQLARGDVKIVFDPNSETVTLLTDREWRKLSGPK